MPSYSGIWTLQAQMQNVAAGKWTGIPKFELYSWGYNNGRLGLGDNTFRSSPVQVGALFDWSLVAAGLQHCIAVKTDGTLWSWGASNSSGQLGLNDTTFRQSPVQVGLLTGWSKVSASNASSFAIKTDGTLWSWGYNAQGQLGLNDTTNRSSPVQVGALTTWSATSAGGQHCIALRTDGTLWSWGRNYAGQLGLGNDYTTPRSSPVQVGALTGWSKISSGAYFSFAIKTDGTMWSWGNNTYGQLGHNNTTFRSSPVQVGALTDWSQVSAGGFHCIAIKTNGTIWSWGRNSVGQLGLGDTTGRSSPVQIGALTTWLNNSSGGYHSVAIKTSGDLWSWGKNDVGQLGLNNTTDRNSPVQVGALTSWVKIAAMPRSNSTFVTKTP